MGSNSFEAATEVIKKIEQHGYVAYFVGGAVRDHLLRLDITDIDIATSATPEEIQSIFPHVIPVGIAHGTVIVRHLNTSYEITTFRYDNMDGVQELSDEVRLHEDLARRDFTINAIAMDKDRNMIDLFQGQTDLDGRIIRAVGNPKERITEDPLRIMRALRLSSQLGFTIEPATLAQMKKLAYLIETVAVERLTNEMAKLFQGPFLEKAIQYMIEINVDAYLPILNRNPQLLQLLANRRITPFTSFTEVIVLFHYQRQQIRISEWMRAWKCSNHERRSAINLYNTIDYFENKGLNHWLVYQLSPTLDKAFVHLTQLLFNSDRITSEQIKSLRIELPIQSRKEMLFDGKQLLHMFPEKKPGRWIENVIGQIEKEIVMGNLHNDKLSIKEWLLCHPPETN